MAKKNRYYQRKSDGLFETSRTINGKRVMMARQMIESGEVAADVAERVGFSDYSTFYRAYRKAYGQSPTEGRRAPTDRGHRA